MKLINRITVIAAIFILSSCGDGKQTPPVSLHWESRGPVEGGYGETLSITNISNAKLGSGWTLYFNQFYRDIVQPGDAPVKIEWINGTYFKAYPTEHFVPLPPGETLTLEYVAGFRTFKQTQRPEGAYIVTARGIPVAVGLTTGTLPLPNDGLKLYEFNAALGGGAPATPGVIPSVKRTVVTGGEVVVERSVVINADEGLSSEAGLLSAELREEFGAETSGGSGTKISLKLDPSLFGERRPEGYRLKIDDRGIEITAQTPAGAFYGTRTLLSALRGAELPRSLPAMDIADWPDFEYRGQHLDIARNYTGKEGVIRLLDLFAAYKLNKFHFHFNDDEGWRVEIPGLPELTGVGALRGHTTDELDVMYPAYGGGCDPYSGSGSGHLDRKDFIEILRYATERHIEVIPEIESPAHSRAAIKAMLARYEKYRDSDPAKAEEYLLTDFGDRSEYWSAQDYTDNVMNVSLDGVYRFMEKVIDEAAAMFAEAGAPLNVVHIGGDEVPQGAWTASEAAARFMAANGIADVSALGEYYILRVNDILKRRGLKMAGWQELVEGRSEDFRRAVKDNIGFINCWHTTGASAQTPYRLANMGYPVALSNVANFYMDLAYSPHPEEPGHWWGGFVDDFRAFSMQPFNIYSSIRIDDKGNPADLRRADKGMEKLTSEGRGNIIGLQAQLWAETIRSFDMVAYSLFPKVLAFAERAWNGDVKWNRAADEQEAFMADYKSFNASVAQREMPWLASRGIVFRVPQPGLRVENKILYANSPITGAEIRFTTDGSQPASGSALWDGPTACEADEVKARLFWQGMQSVTTTWRRE